MSQAIDALVAKNLVARVQEGDDRRQIWLELTPYARRVLDENVQKNRAFIRQKIGTLSAEEQETIVRAMHILKRAFLSD